ncbi:hypothetical protein Bca4012_074150 [Brassica carinata]|uniref:Uncharacterized protein n=3 Tax=Brassica TaxID=3705 RepID=A0A8X7QQI4_BRACI|nr:uncharacterized protein LOC125586981 [Brassica napus]KAG2271893.1 hypothetical protein Bca52824_066448 [Brassica carinata]CAF1934517.1 unnamed protein product [Brassica napus]VDD46321.1 unnamed protein product [Brassica oleracea]
MASASSSAARLLIRDGKSVASLLFRGRAAANLTENTGPAIRSLLLLNQTVVPSQYPVFSETFPVTQPGLGSCFVQEEAVSERRGKMETGQGKRVVNNGGSSSSEEEETDFDEEEFDDIDMDDDVEFDEEEDEEDEQIVKKKK